VLDIRAIGFSVFGALLALVLITLAERWWIRWWVDRFIARSLRDWERGDLKSSRLEPECHFIVQFSNTEVSCTRPDGTIERVAWDDLQRVEIVIIDEGPFLTDRYWLLDGSEGGCLVPAGATGEMELLHRLQQLPGFRNEAVIEATPSTGIQRFLCWEKSSSAAPG
jgi:hypothetical protein